jgi:Zn-dependent protease with chaperone function
MFIPAVAAAIFLAPMLAAAILLLPILSAFLFALISIRSNNTVLWARYRRYARLIFASTVTFWWINLSFLRFPGPYSAFDSHPRMLFWLPPVSSLGIFTFLGYAVDRVLERQHWSLLQLVRRAFWKIASFVIPLEMVAAGFAAILRGRIGGIAWLLAAGIMAKIATGFLRRAEGLRLNRLRSGELRNRAFRMAGQMGIGIDGVYMVPAGKARLLNAFGMSNAIGLTDNVGKYMGKEEVDSLIAHELAHVKLKHARKHLLLVGAIFSVMTLLLFRLSSYALAVQPFAQFAAIFVPLISLYYFSRRFEYAADKAAVEFTGQPEHAIRALIHLHRSSEATTRENRFTELFMTHPSLANRMIAIAKAGEIPARELDRIVTAHLPGA